MKLKETIKSIVNNPLLPWLLLLLYACVRLYLAHAPTTQVLPQGNTDVPKQQTTMTTQSSVQLTSKPTSDSPDLVVKNRYIAKVNGKTYEVPVKTTEDTLEVTQTVDVSPLVEALSPNWSVGVGVGYHDNDVYYPLSIQRDYTPYKAVRFEMHLDKSINHIEGYEIQHVWKF